MKNSKNHGASALFNVLKKKSPEEKAAQAENRGKVIDQVGGFAQKNPEMAKAAGKAIFGAITGGGMYDKMGASMDLAGSSGKDIVKKQFHKFKNRGQDYTPIQATQLGGSMYDEMGASKYSKPKAGASMATSTYQGANMNSYEEKESTMDDYSHEKKLGNDGRFKLEEGDTAAADNDFNHAHALKEDAKYDKKHVVNRISASRSNLT